MKYNPILGFLYATIFLITFSFDTFSSSYAFPSAISKSEIGDTLIKNEEILNYSTKIKNSRRTGFTMEIKTTYINDERYLKNTLVADSNNVVISQKLIFRYNNTVLAIKMHNTKKTKCM